MERQENVVIKWILTISLILMRTSWTIEGFFGNTNYTKHYVGAVFEISIFYINSFLMSFIKYQP